jgi:transposase
MMSAHPVQNDMFSYRVNLDKRVRADHPLRRILQLVDFSFVRAEVQQFYGYNGHRSVDPVVLMKLMFLLFYDNIASERELMNLLPERLDYLWFVGYGLDDAIPDHSVLSKARTRWGADVFKRLFVHTIEQCVAVGLVSGEKLHVDGSLVNANASKDSVIKSSPELIAAYSAAYAAQEKKLADPALRPNYQAVNDTIISTTDPDAGLVRKGADGSRPSYHHHRGIDNAQGVIVAVEATSGPVAENKKLMDVIKQSQENTGGKFRTVVADHKYGTVENYLACHEQGLTSHMGDVKSKAASTGLFAQEDFQYQAGSDTYLCPAGKTLAKRRYIKRQHLWEYAAAKSVCAGCKLRAQCTKSKAARLVTRHEKADLLEQCRAEAQSGRARRDRKRRQYLLEGSFADAANNHGFKRARWRRLWRQQIQDYLIAAIQNVRILLEGRLQKPAATAVIAFGDIQRAGALSGFLDLATQE